MAARSSGCGNGDRGKAAELRVELGILDQPMLKFLLFHLTRCCHRHPGQGMNERSLDFVIGESAVGLKSFNAKF
jgi:hypothetical protein